jgi:hypothetical protein
VREGKTLSLVREPFPDELLTSWLDRTASLYGLSWTELCAATSAGPLSTGSDYKLSGERIGYLSTVTSIDAAVIRSLDLWRKFPRQPVTRFMCHPDTKVAAPDYCEECFCDDFRAGRDHYFRRAWAVAGVSHCRIHECRLRSWCCGADFSPVMKLVNKRIQVYCSGCGKGLGRRTGDQTSEWWQGEPEQSVLDLDDDILRSLKKCRRQPICFQAIEDLAFLFSYIDLPRAARACKPALRGWRKDDARRLGKLTAPVRAGWAYNGAQMFPLASVDADYRCHLMRACSAVLSEVPGSYVCPVTGNPGYRQLDGLFAELDHAGKEELVARADTWPYYLMARVKKIVNRPRSKNPFTRYELRGGWIAGDSRLAVNRGALPIYANF